MRSATFVRCWKPSRRACRCSITSNNRSSKASPANENYARELFELHTLGAEHYYNHLYAKWREVPGALEGKAAGFIDQDVYEAARAFTGWTAADGDDQGDNEVFRRPAGFIITTSGTTLIKSACSAWSLRQTSPPWPMGCKCLISLRSIPAPRSI